MESCKKREFLVLALVFIFLIFSMYFLRQGRIVGFTIYESQPDAADGKDSYIREDFPNNNFGENTGMQIGKTAGNSRLRTLVQFNLSSIPDTDTIVSAKISLYIPSLSGSNLTVLVYLLSSDWTETEVTWNNKSSSSSWSSAGGDCSNNIDSVFINQSGWYNFTVTNAVRGWKNGSYSNYGLLLIAPNATAGNYIDLYSSDYTDDTSLRPKIIVDHSANTVPSIISLTTNSSPSSLKNVDENIAFTISWTDMEGDSAKALVCNSSNISFSAGCIDKTFCNTSYSASSPITCQYQVTNSENRTQEFWTAVCDSINCSEINQSYFYINHFPNMTLVQPNGNEIINQSQGNYIIKFNVSDADSDLLKADIYYGELQNSTNYSVASNLNLSVYCSDPDNNTATKNNCSYSWNTTGIYSYYYLTIKINDTYSVSSDSSDLNFSVISIIDDIAPNITAQWTENYIYSGKKVQIYANVSDPNLDLVWFSINSSGANTTMYNSTSNTYNSSFTAGTVGTYSFKVYARDKVGNTNTSMPWQEFNVSKPVAASQGENAPSTALPYSMIKVTAQLNSSDSLSSVYAYLNVPDGFTFLSGYPQNSPLGNFSVNETKTATWFLSTPITQSAYSLNITYTDLYSNSWNSSNLQIQVTSAIGGGYTLDIAGYPEVETSQNYYAESKFSQNGIRTDPDSITILIYDALGSLTVGPASMTKESTGEYNYIYTVGASVTEGQWETIVNATKSSVSYYANQFWKVVGGPFDIREITIDDAAVSSLTISVTAENTGGANKDLRMIWNLTREDTGANLDSGSDTIRVNASSTRIYTIHPSTDYVGQVRITFLGYYSGTEKAGAYKIFSTTLAEAPVIQPSGGGGGGGGLAELKKEKADFTIKADKIIILTKNIEKISKIEISNTGEEELTNITVSLEGIDKSYYKISPLSVSSLKAGKTAVFEITFFITDFTGEKDFDYVVKTNELEKRESGMLSALSMADFFKKEIERLQQRVSELKNEITDESSIEKLNACDLIVKNAGLYVDNEEYINALSKIKEADSCLDSIKEKAPSPIASFFKNISDYWFWIITWALILLLIAVLVIIVYLIYRKVSIANFLRKEEGSTEKSKRVHDRMIDEKIKSIEKKLGEYGEEDETEA